ncbi:hypothetical protein [Lacimonas salitolerans]|uniref:Hook-length control protein FliK n=1 Tax=Lacimonas salitolerans TaxID=1323750 RepID=A0ABW4EBZ1_9RHOB
MAFPSAGGARADAATVGDAIFAEIFAALGLRGPDRPGDTPAGPPLVPAAGGEQPGDGDPVTGDVALFAKMMHRAKAGLVAPEAGDSSDIPQAVDVAILGGSEAHLSVLRLIGDPDATDIPVDLDKVVAYLARLLKGDASGADAALSGAASEGVPQESGAVLELGTPLEVGVPAETDGNALAASDVELALMQVDGRLAIMVAGALGRISDEIAAYANTIGLAVSAPQQTTGRAAPLVGAEGATLAQASTGPVITATMAVIPPEGRPLTVMGQAATASVNAAALLEKPMAPVKPDVSGAMTSQKTDTSVAPLVNNLTLKPDALSATAVSGDPLIRIAGLAPGAELAGLGGDALREGGTFQPASLDAGPKQGAVLVSLSGPQAGPADQGNMQTAPVVPTADRDLMYLDIARPMREGGTFQPASLDAGPKQGAVLASLSGPQAGPADQGNMQTAPVVPTADRDLMYLDIPKPNVVSAVPLVIAANMKTGRMRSLEQAGGQLSDQRSGLVPQPLPGSEILGARPTDQARAAAARIARGDAPANAVTDLKPATAPDHRATGQAASDMAGPPVAQSGTQTPAGSSGAASAAPMAQSSGLPGMLDVRRQGWTQTLVQRAAGMVQSGGVLTLKILPQHLGQITLKMSEGRRGLDLRIVTEVASTAAMLRGVESQISSAFEGAGLLLGEFSANSGKGGGTAFGDDGDDGDPALAGEADVDETDADTISNDTAQHSLLNIIL